LGSKQDKQLRISLNGNRVVIGTLRGYDAFLNIVLEETENALSGEYLGQVVVRGSSIIQFEGLDRPGISSNIATTTADE
jgi:small nuclear ribonucleoprotein G